MSVPLWRRIERHVRRRMGLYLERELQRLLEPRINELRQDMASAQQEVMSNLRGLASRLSSFEQVVLEHPDILSTSRQTNPFASPGVTVVMPTWNRGHLVGAAIRSVQAQQFSDWELIVVDDGSTDDTDDTMAEFLIDPRIRYVKQEHAGQCAARNYALRLAKGALIAYLDSDNLWYPGFLAAAVEAFTALPSVDCLYGAMITESHRPGQRILFDPFDRNSLLVGNYIGMSTFIHRRSLFHQLGGFDEELSALEDWDLILRYTAHAPAYRLAVLAVRYRALDENRVTVTARMDTASTRIRSKWV
jgi:glycosyltransferase involved in cell wall biosynthesis